MAKTISIDDIKQARERIIGAVPETPFLHSRTLSQLTGSEIYIKFENLQFTASFKERGALNRLLCLKEEERKRGVIAMSAGNHAQGVAYHANRLSIPAVIVMPRGTPFVKIRHTESFGARVILEGENLAEAAAHARKLEEAEGLFFIHPYDDELVIAGQGTVGLEMLEQNPELEALVVPVGGGGLIAGVSVAARALKPELEIIGVQSARYPAMQQILAGEEISCGKDTVAEGIAVKTPGLKTREIIARLVDQLVLVDEKALERAISLLINIEKTVAEGAGAAALAAVLAAPERFRGRKTALVLSGGNIDSRILASILMRDLVREGRIARIQVTISDSPGELARIAAIVAEKGGNIIDVAHHRVFSHVSVKNANLDLAVETRDATHIDAILESMAELGLPAHLLGVDQ